MKPSAMEALVLWDEGKPVPAIEVASDGATQNDIYAVAFELLRRHKEMEDEAGATVGLEWMSRHSEGDAFKIFSASLNVEHGPLSDREFDAAASLATVAALKGWSVMLGQHEHQSIMAIEVQKPKPAGSSA